MINFIRRFNKIRATKHSKYGIESTVGVKHICENGTLVFVPLYMVSAENFCDIRTKVLYDLNNGRKCCNGRPTIYYEIQNRISPTALIGIIIEEK